MGCEILIVDDEADIRFAVSGILEDEGYSVRESATAQATLKALRLRLPHLVILDIWLEGSDCDGVALLKIIKETHPDLPVVMMSGHGTIETAVGAIHDGAFDFIEKPFKADRLLLIIKRAIEDSRLRRENRSLREKLPVQTQLIGTGPAMTALKSAIEKVAPTGSRVLITGPAGAGKEVVARQLHQHSMRREHVFTVLNCATLHPERLEVALFGEEVEGGVEIKAGVLEQSHGGTLFLDEVADMPIETQGKVVRVLQDQSFQRVGGLELVNVDVRVLASTSKDLLSLVRQGVFREDLFYRLSVVPLIVPPLKDRREDLPDLFAAFMAFSAQSNGLLQRTISADALRALQACDWPGNVRQLRNVVEWLLIMAPGEQGSVITATMLPPDLDATDGGKRTVDGDLFFLPLRAARESFERQYLSAQMSRFSGNISKTSDFVGMERSALHRKLKTLGLTAEKGEP